MCNKQRSEPPCGILPALATYLDTAAWYTIPHPSNVCPVTWALSDSILKWIDGNQSNEPVSAVCLGADRPQSHSFEHTQLSQDIRHINHAQNHWSPGGKPSHQKQINGLCSVNYNQITGIRYGNRGTEFASATVLVSNNANISFGGVCIISQVYPSHLYL